MNSRTPDSIKQTVKIWIVILMAISIGIIAFGIASYSRFTADIPSVETLKTYAPPTVTKFYSDEGEVIEELFIEKREVIPLSRMPNHLIQAFVAGEDARFFQHKGLDYVAILRALFRNIFSGEIVEGGSTITQQVVKSLLLTPEKTFTRKFREAILAYRIEKYLSKEEILFLYLNQIYLGHGAYGVATAAETYFGKPVEELNLAESALLAGLTQAPSRNSPFQNPDQAKKRQAYVLHRMTEEGSISSEDLERTLRAPLRLTSKPFSPLEKAPYFVEHVRKYVEEKYGKEALYKKGLRVYTTVDLGMQKAAEEALELGLKEIEKRQKYPAQTASASLEGALISFDLDTGYVKALVGGRNYRRSQFNRVTQARRQTGSAFKPIVYAAAMDRNYTPASIVVDSPILFQWGDKKWRPKNFEREFRGAITVRTALTHSVNVVTVKIAQGLGIDYLYDYARSLGISSPLHRDLSMALGSSALSLFELAKAYAVFANEGKILRPIIVKKILDQDGNLLEENPPLFLSQEPLEDIQVISPQTAYLMTNLLQSVVQDGTGWRAKSLGRPVAGKTGTTDQFCDAWFIGYTPELLTGVWVGFDEERSLGENETGSRAASPIWVNFMSKVLKDKPLQDFFIPDGIDFIEIDPRTGDLSSGKDGFLECFKEGTGPGQVLHARSMGSADFFKLDFNLDRK
jgi:penicillin-binding protein 1A